MDEIKLRQYIRTALQEQDESGEKKKSSGKRGRNITKAGQIGLSTGKGGFTKVVADAGALAKKNPKQLMSNLEITKGASGYNGVVTIINQAINGAGPMKQAYGGVSKITQGNKAGLKISMGELDSRNGAKFLHHTLMGAIAAGLYTLDIPLQIDVLGGDVIVYESETKGSWKVEK